jgi:integrase
MKSNKEHHVPLSSAAAQILKEIWTEGDHGFIFSHKHLRRPLSDMAMLNVLRRRKLPFTVHGFRATFRTWAAEKTNVQNDVAEAALAHSVGNKVVAAYQRGDLFEKRRTLMKTWANFLQNCK